MCVFLVCATDVATVRTQPQRYTTLSLRCGRAPSDRLETKRMLINLGQQSRSLNVPGDKYFGRQLQVINALLVDWW